MNRQQRREQALEKHQSWELPHTLVIEMDGAYLDSVAWLYEVYTSFLQKLGFSGSKPEFQELIGLPLPEFLVQLCDRHSLRRSQEKLLKEYETLLLEKYNAEIPLLPNAEKALLWVTQQGLTCLLVCGMTKPLVTKYLASNPNTFEKVIIPEETEALPTDFSNMYHQAIVEQGTDPAEAIAIVYSNHAREAAKEAGMTVWQLSPKQNLHDKLTISPQKCIPVADWQTIFNFLQTRYA